MTTTEPITLLQFVTDNLLTMTAERTDSNPSLDDSANMDHWKVTIRCGSRRMSLVFSMGYGHYGELPKLVDVLDCLASDASSYDNAQSFEDWADELGMDTDSRKALRTFKTVQRQSEKLRTLLGDEAYMLLTDGSVERL